MQPPDVSQFQDALLNGRWDDALTLLPRLAGGSSEVLLEATFTVRALIEALCLSGCVELRVEG
eukprot:63395-Chlamydomonas_euryale.AAC.1